MVFFMLKLGKLADYATALMTAMASAPDQVHTAQGLSDRTRVSAPTTAKLLKLLAKGGLVESLRGAPPRAGLPGRDLCRG